MESGEGGGRQQGGHALEKLGHKEGCRAALTGTYAGSDKDFWRTERTGKQKRKS